jgi:uncharacterized membrane protein YkoI
MAGVMTKWIPGLLLAAAALSSHSVDAKESRGTSTTSATKPHSANSDTSATTATKHSNHQSRFNQDDAREALKKGKVMPLTAILDIAARREPGTVIAVDLETHRNGKLIYEIDVITEDGRRRELQIDARKGDILSVEDD